jgi:hypothetical protein
MAVAMRSKAAAILSAAPVEPPRATPEPDLARTSPSAWLNGKTRPKSAINSRKVLSKLLADAVPDMLDFMAMTAPFLDYSYVPKSKERDDEIASLYASGMRSQDIADRFGISRGLVHLIAKRETPTHKEIENQIGRLQKAWTSVGQPARDEFLRRLEQEAAEAKRPAGNV